jgi:hypothetical protein
MTVYMSALALRVRGVQKESRSGDGRLCCPPRWPLLAAAGRRCPLPAGDHFSGSGFQLGMLSSRDVRESAAAEDAHLRHIVVLAEHPEVRDVAVQLCGGQPVLQPRRMMVGMSPEVRGRSCHHGVSKVTDVTEGLLRRTVPLVLVGR